MPDTPRQKELQGCPDRDGDGVIDMEDDCPDQAGLPELKGCPDRDGDGIPWQRRQMSGCERIERI